MNNTLALINNRNVENFLKSLRSGEPPPENLFQLSMLSLVEFNSKEARSLRLAEILNSEIIRLYKKTRKAEGLSPDLPENRTECINRIKEDFSAGNSDLESWSTLYFRYLSAVNFSVEDLSSAASVVPQQFRRRLNQGLTFLVEALRKMEFDLQRKKKPSTQYLPIPDFTRLVGNQPVLSRLSQLFTCEDGARLVSLEGMGGIGKTAAARAFVSLPETISHWQNIYWISARPSSVEDFSRGLITSEAESTLEDILNRLAEQMGIGYLASRSEKEKLEGIRTALNQQPSLVVVDNLETVNDYIQLVPALAQLAVTSRFLITSRETLRNFSFVQVIQVPELDNAASFELLKQEETRRGRPFKVLQQDFDDLYQVIGGIPLAIKLVAAQLNLRPLAEILQEFKNAENGLEGFYRYIYWKIWQQLSDAARRLLLSFLSADPEGEDLEFLQIISGQEEKSFYQAVEEIDQVSLLEITGSPSEPHYRLHRLTITFLQTELLDFWKASVGNDM